MEGFRTTFSWILEVTFWSNFQYFFQDAANLEKCNPFQCEINVFEVLRVPIFMIFRYTFQGEFQDRLRTSIFEVLGRFRLHFGEPRQLESSWSLGAAPGQSPVQPNAAPVQQNTAPRPPPMGWRRYGPSDLWCDGKTAFGGQNV